MHALGTARSQPWEAGSGEGAEREPAVFRAQGAPAVAAALGILAMLDALAWCQPVVVHLHVHTPSTARAIRLSEGGCAKGAVEEGVSKGLWRGRFGRGC